jgi:hypothetical protein
VKLVLGVVAAVCVLSGDVWAASSYAPLTQDCGEFDVAGVVAFDHHHYVIKVSAGSQSETILTVAPAHQELAAPYVNRSVLAHGRINRKIATYRGTIDLEKIEQKVPDPIHPRQNSGFKLVEKRECDKS